MTPQEIEALRSEALKDKVEALSDMVDALKAERDAAMREASELAMCIWRTEFQKLSPDFELCDSPAGVISQIDHMYAAMRSERDMMAATLERIARYPTTRVDELSIEHAREIARKAIAGTPQQCLRDMKAKAGLTGFIAGFNESGEGFNGEYGVSDKRILELANEYAATVRKGGAE